VYGTVPVAAWRSARAPRGSAAAIMPSCRS